MEQTPLCELALKYRTDKCPQLYHSYTPVYYELLKDKKHFKKILELGIGTKFTMRHTDNYNAGASLRMWRDFFPNAQIYGVDIVPEAIIEEERIKTFLLDTTNPEDMKKLIGEIGSDLDLVIDDGPHRAKNQIWTCRTLMPLLNKNVIYVIEDSSRPDAVKANLPEYDVEVIRLRKVHDDTLIIVRHK